MFRRYFQAIVLAYEHASDEEAPNHPWAFDDDECEAADEWCHVDLARRLGIPDVPETEELRLVSGSNGERWCVPEPLPDRPW